MKKNQDFKYAERAFNGILHTKKVKLFYKEKDKVLGFTLNFDGKTITKATRIAKKEMLLEVSNILIRAAKETLLELAISKLRPIKQPN